MKSHLNPLLVGAVVVLAACSEPTTRVLPLGDVQLTLVSGNGQVGSINQELPQPLVVKVTGMNNKGIKGLLLNFRVTSGGGRMYAGAALTDQDGVAHDYWTLGASAGAQQVDVVAVDPSTGKQNYGSFQATALAPASLSITPSSANFGTVTQGSSSTPQSFTVRNVGGETSGGVTVTVGGAHAADFALGPNTCAAPLVGGATCTVSVTFSPNGAGARAATVTAAASPGGAASSNVSGSGIQLPVLTFNPTSYAFGSVSVGATSPGQNFTLTNTGTAPAASVIVGLGGTNGGDFLILGTSCANGMTLNPGQSCGGAVAFRPTAAGARAATLNAGASGGSTSAPLTGTGLGVATLTIAPTLVNFGTVVVGTNSNTQSFAVTNTGQAVSGVVTSAVTGVNAADFVVVINSCTGIALSPGQNCTISARFSPTATGSRAAFLNVSATPGGAASASLSGTGSVGGAILTVIPASQNFGSILLGQTSTPILFTVRNDGGGSALLTMAITGTNAAAFIKSADNCSGATLNPSDTCTLLIAFAPTIGGAHAAVLSSGQGATGLASLSGTGLTPAQLSALPPFQDFGLNGIGVPSRSFRIVVQNTGGTPTGLIGITINGPNASEFVMTSNLCSGVSLGPTSSCAIDIVFTPTAAGSRSAVLSVNAAPGGSLAVNLTGTGS